MEIPIYGIFQTFFHGTKNTELSQIEQILETNSTYNLTIGTGAIRMACDDIKISMEVLMAEAESKKTADDALKSFRKSVRRKKMIAVAIAVVLMAGAGGGYCYIKFANEETDIRQRLEEHRGMQGLRDLVTAGGTTSVGMVTEEFEIDYLDTELTIEEVLLSSGDEVEAGTPILKVEEEDIQDALKELERLAKESSIAYRQGKIDYLLGKIEAQAVYDTALAENEYAEADYNVNIKEARQEIADLEEKTADAKELYEEYYNGIHNNGYYEEYKVAELKQIYEEHKSLYEEYLKRWNIDDTEVNNSGQGSSGAGGNSGSGSGGPGGGSANTDKQERLTALGLLEDEYRENKEEYEQALEDYEKALETAQAGLAAVQDDYELQNMELEQAKIDYEKKAVSYLADYESAQMKAATAQDTYNTALKRLQEDLENLEYAQETAAENLAEFKEVIGDGYLYTSEKGTVVMVPIRKNTVLTEDSIILAYSNPDKIIVTAAVSQDSIAKLTVGDEAVAVFEEYGNFGGVITSINPVSNSNSRTSVTYSVEITLNGDVSTLSANKTATVVFGYSLAEFEKAVNGVEEGEKTDEK